VRFRGEAIESEIHEISKPNKIIGKSMRRDVWRVDDGVLNNNENPKRQKERGNDQ
jgi:hypothetical protein